MLLCKSSSLLLWETNVKCPLFALFSLLGLLFAAFPVFADTAVGNCPELNAAQKFFGYVTMWGFIQFLAIVIFSISVMALFGNAIKKVIAKTRVILEIASYLVASFLLIGSYWFVTPEYQSWTVSIGALVFMAAVFGSIWIHQIKGDDPKPLATLFMVVWGIAAIVYNLPFVGGLSVMALMTLLGFSVFITHASYAFGYQNESDVASGTLASLFVLAAGIFTKLVVPDTIDAVAAFHPGIFWVSSFVGFLGLLIISDRYYCEHVKLSYWPMQFLAFGIMFVAAGIGFAYDITPLGGMAGTFLMFYLASKPIDFKPKDVVEVSIVGMVSSGILAALWYVGTTYQDAVLRFLNTAA